MMKMTQQLKSNNVRLIVLMILSIVLISIALPRQSAQFIDEQMVGEVWKLPDMIATYDLQVYRDSNEMKHVRDSVARTIIPYYEFNTELPKQVTDSLNRALIAAEVDATARYNLIRAVTEIYGNGVVDDDTYDLIKRDKLNKIFINGRSQAASTAKMMSQKAAIARIDSSFTGMREAITASGLRVIMKPNLLEDHLRTQTQIDIKATTISHTPVKEIKKGQRIIDFGDIITAEKFKVITAYYKEREQQLTTANMNFILGGKVAVTTIMMMVFYFFMYFMRPRTFANQRKMVFLITFMTAFVVAVFLLARVRSYTLYVIPFAIVPIIVTTFFDSRTSFFYHMTVILICSLVASNQAEFIILQFLAGTIAIASMRELTRRSQLANCAFFIFVAMSVSFVAMYVMREGKLDGMEWAHMFTYFAINSIMLSFAYVLIFLIEKLFGFTSTVTLVELSDINTPVLRQLSNECQGTFQHSLQVANLASEAAHAIGANTQLVRAGALYHDIGKLDNPAFFTENQHGVNPHDSLSPDQSAHIVISHVTNGLERAAAARLPQAISDFIAQHHGKGRAKYFYTQACNEHPNEEIDPAPFTYPGPNPQTKETAIVMMADACEAAAKSLTDRSNDAITNLVNKVIDSQIADGLLRESPISFTDVEKVKSVFVKSLHSFYHVRVSYPDAIKPKAEPTAIEGSKQV